MIGTPQPFSIRLSLCAALVLACAGQDKPVQERTEAAGNRADMFINRVWRVQTSSGVEPGTLYAFLSGGALVIASPHGTPSLGSWKYSGDTLTLIEEGLSHPADVVTLTHHELQIRVHSPGPPLDITLVPAEMSWHEEKGATR
jgi:hypothetical protein